MKFSISEANKLINTIKKDVLKENVGKVTFLPQYIIEDWSDSENLIKCKIEDIDLEAGSLDISYEVDGEEDAMWATISVNVFEKHKGDK